MNCKGCGKVIPGINLEFGGAVRLSVDGDDYACNSGCVERARAAHALAVTLSCDTIGKTVDLSPHVVVKLP